MVENVARLTAAEASKLVFHDEAGEWKVVTRWLLRYHDTAILTTGDGRFWKYVYSMDDAEEDIFPDEYVELNEVVPEIRTYVDYVEKGRVR